MSRRVNRGATTRPRPVGPREPRQTVELRAPGTTRQVRGRGRGRGRTTRPLSRSRTLVREIAREENHPYIDSQGNFMYTTLSVVCDNAKVPGLIEEHSNGHVVIYTNCSSDRSSDDIGNPAHEKAARLIESYCDEERIRTLRKEAKDLLRGVEKDNERGRRLEKEHEDQLEQSELSLRNIDKTQRRYFPGTPQPKEREMSDEVDPYTYISDPFYGMGLSE
jgi:hypothetical protein